MKTMQQTTVNGVNVDQLVETIGAIKQQPGLAKFTFRAQNRWIDGGHVRTAIRDFHGAGGEDTSRRQTFILEGDEPAVLLGKDHGPNATEAVLHALVTCVGTTLVYHAAAKGIRIESLEFDVEGDLDLHGFLGLSDKVRNGFQNIRITARIKADGTKEQVEELVRVGQRYSPVFDIVTNPVPVTVQTQVL